MNVINAIDYENQPGPASEHVLIPALSVLLTPFNGLTFEDLTEGADKPYVRGVQQKEIAKMDFEEVDDILYKMKDLGRDTMQKEWKTYMREDYATLHAIYARFEELEEEETGICRRYMHYERVYQSLLKEAVACICQMHTQIRLEKNKSGYLTRKVWVLDGPLNKEALDKLENESLEQRASNAAAPRVDIYDFENAVEHFKNAVAPKPSSSKPWWQFWPSVDGPLHMITAPSIMHPIQKATSPSCREPPVTVPVESLIQRLGNVTMGLM